MKIKDRKHVGAWSRTEFFRLCFFWIRVQIWGPNSSVICEDRIWNLEDCTSTEYAIMYGVVLVRLRVAFLLFLSTISTILDSVVGVVYSIDAD